jgi:hypothetical protein
VRNVVDDDKLHVYKGNKLQLADLREQAFFSALPSANIDDRKKIDRRNLLAYMEVKNSRGSFKVNFKLIDTEKDNSNGYVCVATSTLTVPRLKEFISAIESKVNLKKNKPDLCDLYEILLRAKHPRVFSRVYESKQIFNKT